MQVKACTYIRSLIRAQSVSVRLIEVKAHIFSNIKLNNLTYSKNLYQNSKFVHFTY